MNLFRSLALTLALLGLLPAAAQAEPIDVELVLAVDVSGSVNTDRYEAQKLGYINAFTNSVIHNSIMGGTIGGIAVTYMEWSGSGQQAQQVGWTKITNAAESNAFAAAIGATSRAYSGLTGIAGGIDWSTNAIASNDYEGTRQVIDISGDGTENVCTTCLPTSRTAAVAAGNVINGIAIEEVTSFSLTDYYQNNVIGGGDSFVKTAATFGDFEQAMIDKLQIEITGENPVPAPATLGLLGIGLLGLAAGRRRRRTAA